MSIYIYSTILLIILSLIYIKFAVKFKIIDKPNHRSSHDKLTIRGGGILFLFGLLIYFVVSGFQYPYFVLGTTLIAIISFIDDMVTLSSKIRWPFQVFAAMIMFYQIGLGYFPFWSYLPLIFIAVGFINFFNFMDGINGITGLSSLVALGGFYYLNQSFLVVENAFIITMMISVLVFGFFNFRKKAVMFAGDIGSITIAMVLFFLGVQFAIAADSTVIIGFYYVFGADSFFTFFYRLYKREKLSEPHRSHIYQKLVDNFNLTHIQVSLYYSLLQIVISVLAIYLVLNVNVMYQYVVGASVAFLLLILYVYLFKQNEKKLAKK